MIPTEVIKRKREGENLNPEEISSFILAYTRGDLPDYQMAAWLMAVFLKGLNQDEMIQLTQVMLDSGKRVHFPENFYAVDKHSTGGVGDKTSLILAPLVAACGVPVPMMSGRGLGHTGGTLDKLESIPGFQVQWPLKDFQSQVEKYNLCFVGQTEEICPADKKIYALRDVTATVESLPLICASIMSKKIAEGISGLVLDVKVGSGAFMKTQDQAQALAHGLLSIAKGHGIKATALITDMSQPLGRFVGNALEVHECLSILKGDNQHPFSHEAFDDCKSLSLELASHMVALGKKQSFDQAKSQVQSALDTGQALEVFAETCARQGGRWKDLPELGPAQPLLAEHSGILSSINCEQVGWAGIEIGAGRQKSEDTIDPTSGFFFHKKVGDLVQAGETLVSLFPGQSSTAQTQSAKARLRKAIHISDRSVAIKPNPLIYQVL